MSWCWSGSHGDDDALKAAVEVIAIGWAGDPEVTEWLRERSIADPDEDVRQVAAQALFIGEVRYEVARAQWFTLVRVRAGSPQGEL